MGPYQGAEEGGLARPRRHDGKDATQSPVAACKQLGKRPRLVRSQQNRRGMEAHWGAFFREHGRMVGTGTDLGTKTQITARTCSSNMCAQLSKTATRQALPRLPAMLLRQESPSQPYSG